MKIILYLFDSVPRVCSEAYAELQSGGDILKDSPRAERILLFGLRSPGDQLQVVAIRPSQANEGAWLDKKS
jgi:hypothetical protein